MFSITISSLLEEYQFAGCRNWFWNVRMFLMLWFCTHGLEEAVNLKQENVVCNLMCMWYRFPLVVGYERILGTLRNWFWNIKSVDDVMKYKLSVHVGWKLMA